MDISNELESLIKIIDNTPLCRKTKLLKDKLYQDKELSILLENYKKSSNNIYSSEHLFNKKKLYSNKTFVEFKECEIELNYLIREINQKLSVLREGKSCL